MTLVLIFTPTPWCSKQMMELCIKNERNATHCNTITCQKKSRGLSAGPDLYSSQEHLLDWFFFPSVVQVWFVQCISAQFFSDGWKFVHSWHMANVQWLSPAVDVHSATSHLNNYWSLVYFSTHRLNLVLNYNTLHYTLEAFLLKIFTDLVESVFWTLQLSMYQCCN